MRITYLPPLSDRLGVNEEELILDSPVTLGQLMADLAARHGQEMAPLFFDHSGEWAPQVGIFVDGHAVLTAEYLIAPEAQVMLIPRLAGG